MDIRQIRTESDDETALAEIASLMGDDPLLGIPEGERLDLLATLVHAYEAGDITPCRHPIRSPPSSSGWSYRA